MAAAVEKGSSYKLKGGVSMEYSRNSTGNFLRLPSRELHVMILETTLMALITITSLVGNILMCVVIYRTNTPRRVTNCYLVALSCAGILMASLDMPLVVAVLYNGEWKYGEFLCNLQGFTGLLFGIGTPLMIGLIAVNRYVCILKPNLYRRWFSIKYSVRTIICGWISAAVTIAIPWVAGYSKFRFNNRKACCFITIENQIVDTLHSTIILLIYVFSPLCLVIYCYSKVLFVVQKHKVSVGITNQSTLGPSVEDINITYILLAVVLGFLICMIPVIVLECLDTFCASCMSRAAQLAYIYFGCMSTALNPLVYGLVNRRFRREVKRVFVCEYRQIRARVSIETTI